ncbi:LodA/GoxA family CTQ-dependent oxidase (plasmid) [Yersinia sp. HM-2024]|uniref:LodA/GoxA family CTQ-dependent oxidase n=1 Tax=Yersinia sp. HM-2024 TaxID=3344550 RepID=UPI00370D54FD
MKKSNNVSDHFSPKSAKEDSEIVYAKIHPGIGIARVGNSPDEYFIGPEYPLVQPLPYGSMRDSSGAIKRQAARFRVYGYNKAGVAIRELTPDIADIEWKVEVANTKASWYVFDVAMDQRTAKEVPRRNPDVTELRRELEIRPPAKTICGKNTDAVQLDGGTFFSVPANKKVPVNLGELRTDEQGRLLVLGGHGLAESPSGAPLLVYDDEGKEHNFNNSVDWYDDISDGPISAKVQLKGKDIPVTGAWVVVAPPDYAPGIVPFRSLYDMALNTAIDAGMVSADEETSYTKHILPQLERLSGLQWVNLGSAQLHGPGGSYPINTALIHELANDASQEKREEVYKKFRAPDDETSEGNDALKWPPLYGDAYGLNAPALKGDLLPVSAQSYKHLTNFSQSHFSADLNKEDYPLNSGFPAPVYAKPLEESPIAEQPARLDAGPLSYCCADAFHPGCELTWTMRHASLYSEVARIKLREPHLPREDYGDILTPEQAVAKDGPLHAQAPGDLTRWMGVPWHGDTARCRSGYDPEFHPYLPSYWPASVPNQVLSEENFLIYANTDLSDETRHNAFQFRDVWMRKFMTEFDNPEDTMQAMVKRFDEMGIVQRRLPPADYAEQHPTVFVEQLKSNQKPLSKAASAIGGYIDGSPVKDRDELLKEAGWTDEAWNKFQRRL